MTSLVDMEIDDGVAIVSLNRPDVRNAINDALRAKLVAVLERIGDDKSFGRWSSPGEARHSARVATSPA